MAIGNRQVAPKRKFWASSHRFTNLYLNKRQLLATIIASNLNKLVSMLLSHLRFNQGIFEFGWISLHVGYLLSLTLAYFEFHWSEKLHKPLKMRPNAQDPQIGPWIEFFLSEKDSVTRGGSLVKSVCRSTQALCQGNVDIYRRLLV